MSCTTMHEHRSKYLIGFKALIQWHQNKILFQINKFYQIEFYGKKYQNIDNDNVFNNRSKLKHSLYLFKSLINILYVHVNKTLLT